MEHAALSPLGVSINPSIYFLPVSKSSPSPVVFLLYINVNINTILTDSFSDVCLLPSKYEGHVIEYVWYKNIVTKLYKLKKCWGERFSCTGEFVESSRDWSVLFQSLWKLSKMALYHLPKIMSFILWRPYDCFHITSYNPGCINQYDRINTYNA